MSISSYACNAIQILFDLTGFRDYYGIDFYGRNLHYNRCCRTKHAQIKLIRFNVLVIYLIFGCLLQLFFCCLRILLKASLNYHCCSICWMEQITSNNDFKSNSPDTQNPTWLSIWQPKLLHVLTDHIKFKNKVLIILSKLIIL